MEMASKHTVYASNYSICTASQEQNSTAHKHVLSHPHKALCTHLHEGTEGSQQIGTRSKFTQLSTE